MPMNKQLFIVLVWAHLELSDQHGAYSEVIHLGETPIFADGQEVALKPAIDELITQYNTTNVDMLPENASFFATIKTSYRGMYFDALDNDPEEDN